MVFSTSMLWKACTINTFFKVKDDKYHLVFFPQFSSNASLRATFFLKKQHAEHLLVKWNKFLHWWPRLTDSFQSWWSWNYLLLLILFLLGSWPPLLPVTSTRPPGWLLARSVASVESLNALGTVVLSFLYTVIYNSLFYCLLTLTFILE